MTTASLAAPSPAVKAPTAPRVSSALHIAHFAMRGSRITRTGGPTDERLRQGAPVVQKLAKVVGKNLGLGSPRAVQLSSGDRTMLVYSPGRNQLCGVLGSRHRVWPLLQRQGLDLEEGGAPHVPVRDPASRAALSGLDDIDGVLGGWIGVTAKTPYANTLPAHFQDSQLSAATIALRGLFQCSAQVGLPATGAEVLFPDHRLVVAFFTRGCVSALAALSANDRVLLGATRVLAQRAEATCWLLPRFSASAPSC